MKVQPNPPDELTLRLRGILEARRIRVWQQLEAALAAVAQDDDVPNLEHLISLAAEAGIGHGELLERVRAVREIRRLEAEAAEHEEAASRLEKEYNTLRSKVETARKAFEKAREVYERLDAEARSLQSQKLAHAQAAASASARAAALRQRMAAPPPESIEVQRAQAWARVEFPAPGDGALVGHDNIIN